MIVDDSIIARTVLSRMVDSSGDMTVVAALSSAESALDSLRTISPDVILLDLEMPGMGGLRALPKILKAAPSARVLVVSTLTVAGAEQSVAALSLGAADTLPKPGSRGRGDPYRDLLIGKIRALGRAPELRPTVVAAARKSGAPATAAGKQRAAVIAIGASTGGIHAQSRLFGALPRRLDVPVLVTQHLPSSFVPVFARQLALASGHEALVAADDMAIVPGRVLVAPGDAHLTVRRKAGALVVKLDRRPVDTGCMPSVDPMLASLASELGSGVLGVVLSGMGRDGAKGAARVVAAGGTVFAQDEDSCAVWGMPRAVAEAGLAAAILPPEEIASRIAANIGIPPCK